MDSTLPLLMALRTLNSSFLLEPSATPPYQLKSFQIKPVPFQSNSFVLIEVFPLKSPSLFNKNLQFRPNGKGMQFRLNIVHCRIFLFESKKSEFWRRCWVHFRHLNWPKKAIRWRIWFWNFVVLLMPSESTKRWGQSSTKQNSSKQALAPNLRSQCTWRNHCSDTAYPDWFEA